MCGLVAHSVACRLVVKLSLAFALKIWLILNPVESARNRANDKHWWSFLFSGARFVNLPALFDVGLDQLVPE